MRKRDGCRGRIHTISRQDDLPLLLSRWQARARIRAVFFEFKKFSPTTKFFPAAGQKNTSAHARSSTPPER